MTERLACACGAVGLDVEQTPIITTECHCNSCREAGTRLGLAGVPAVLEDNGGTQYVLYRKDRIRFVSGMERLREFRLTPASKTRRVVATCCNTPVFLEFESGHWLSLYAGLWPQRAHPPMEIRTMTGDRADPSPLPQDVPHGTRQTLGFYARLLGAWIAMGFRSPKIDVNGEFNA
jgi:hypothetical protein